MVVAALGRGAKKNIRGLPSSFWIVEMRSSPESHESELQSFAKGREHQVLKLRCSRRERTRSMGERYIFFGIKQGEAGKTCRRSIDDLKRKTGSSEIVACYLSFGKNRHLSIGMVLLEKQTWIGQSEILKRRSAQDMVFLHTQSWNRTGNCGMYEGRKVESQEETI